MNFAELEDTVKQVSLKSDNGLAGMFEAVQLLLKPNGKCLVICKHRRHVEFVLQHTCALIECSVRLAHIPEIPYHLHQSDIRLENGSVLRAFSMESDPNRLRGMTFDLAVWL